MNNAVRRTCRYLVICGGLGALGVIGPRMWVAVRDVLPFRVSVSDWQPEAVEHRWLAVRGWRAPEAAAIVDETADADGATATATATAGVGAAHVSWIYVPIVTPGWSPRDPVRAVAALGPYSPEEARRHAREALSFANLMEHIGQPRTSESLTTGSRVELSSIPKVAEHFRLGSDAVVVREGAKPPPAPGLLLGGVACVFAVAYNAIRLSGETHLVPDPDDDDA